MGEHLMFVIELVVFATALLFGRNCLSKSSADSTPPSAPPQTRSSERSPKRKAKGFLLVVAKRQKRVIDEDFPWAHPHLEEVILSHLPRSRVWPCATRFMAEFFRK